MASLDPVDYDPFLGAPQPGDAHRVPGARQAVLVPVDHDPFADDGAADRVLTRLGVGSVPNSTAGSWGWDPASVGNVRFTDAGLPDANGNSRQFTPTPSSSQKRSAASILSCDTAYIRCMQSRSGNPLWCDAARKACLNTGVPTIFPGGFIGLRG